MLIWRKLPKIDEGIDHEDLPIIRTESSSPDPDLALNH